MKTSRATHWFLIGACLALTACTTNDTINLPDNLDAHQLLRRAHQQTDSAQYLVALENVKFAIAINPELADAWRLLGWLLFLDYRYGPAAWTLDEAHRLNPDNAYLHWLSGLTHFKLGNFTTADNFLSRSLSLAAPTRGAMNVMVAHDLLGKIALELVHNAKAEAHFGEALQFNTENWQAYFLRGLARYRQGKYQASISDFQKAVDRQSRNPTIWNALGWALFRDAQLSGNMARHVTATRAADRALALNADMVSPYVLRGLLSDTDAHYAQAAKWFKKAIQRKPSDVELRLLLARSLLRLGDRRSVAAAERALVTGVAVAPTYTDPQTGERELFLTLFALYMTTDREREAAALFQWLLQRIPD